MAGGVFYVDEVRPTVQSEGDPEGRQAFHRNGGLAGYDIICFRRTPLLKGDDIKSELGEACGEA